MEVAVNIDFGELFIRACYNCEGDGLEIVRAYDILAPLQIMAVSPRALLTMPNVRALAKNFAEWGDAEPKPPPPPPPPPPPQPQPAAGGGGDRPRRAASVGARQLSRARAPKTRGGGGAAGGGGGADDDGGGGADDGGGDDDESDDEFLDDQWRTEDGWLNFAEGVYQPAFDKLIEKFGTNANIYSGELALQVRAARGARIFNVFKLSSYSDEAVHGMIDDLATFPFLRDSINDLKVQWPAMKVVASTVDVTRADKDDEILAFWYTQRAEASIKAWHDAFLKVALVPASSAAVERLFSHLRRMFDATQTDALRDYIETAVMLRYNNRKS
jgi:hypothetical protein